MDCIACRKEAGYNRVVVDDAGDVSGGFCKRCEESVFGTFLQGNEHDEYGTNCSFCDRPGAVALPEWVPGYSEDGGDIIVHNFYEVTPATVRLCRAHLKELASEPLPQVGGV